MEGRQFDNWVRKLARLQSRRDILKKGLGAAVAGGALAGRAAPHTAFAQETTTTSTTTTTTTTTEEPTTTTTTTAAPATTTTTTATPATTTTSTPTTTTTGTPTTTTTSTPTTTTTGTPTTTTAGPTTTTTTTKPPPLATVTPVRGTAGTTFDYTIVGFPNSTLTTIFLIGAGGVSVNLGSVTTSATGTASGTLTVPAVRGGAKEVRFTAGAEVETVAFEIVPRIRITPGSVLRGQTVAAGLTGFGAIEVVNIRWLAGGAYVQVGQVTTGANGSATVNVVVPANADLGANSVRGDGPTFAAQTNAVTVLPPAGPPTAVLAPTRGTVNTTVGFTLTNFPASATVSITWRRTSGSLISIGTVQTNASGGASGSFLVPATAGGANQQVRFFTGASSAVAVYEVAPRIKVDAGARGASVGVSLRGFGQGETVRIRWLVNGSYIQVGTVTTSNSGSANVNVTVPANAALGNNSVRGDGTTFRAQTNVALVTG